jgi:hypothetical protein
MADLDVDDVAGFTYLNSDPAQPDRLQVIFKDGREVIYEGAELPEVLKILGHWTPPMA